jgi:uncharacterized glyoxalase superfamily protein PhnB
MTDGDLTVTRAVPILRIFDVAKAREFYVDFMGFAEDWQHRFGENLPLYMQVSLGGLVLHLSEHHGDACPGAAVRLEVTGLRAFQRRLLAKAYRFAQPEIETTSWGSIAMKIQDPFGNRLVFDEKESAASPPSRADR